MREGIKRMRHCLPKKHRASRPRRAADRGQGEKSGGWPILVAFFATRMGPLTRQTHFITSAAGTAPLKPKNGLNGPPAYPPPPGKGPCAKEAIRDAFGKLRIRLATSCPTCTTYVFNILGRTQPQLYRYLSLAPRLFDGTRSNQPATVLCGLASGSEGLSKWVWCFQGMPPG